MDARRRLTNIVGFGLMLALVLLLAMPDADAGRRNRRDESLTWEPGVDLYGPSCERDVFWSGTSFATVIASGACALAPELNPEMDSEDVVKRFAAAVDVVWDWGFPVIGSGRINFEMVAR